MDFEKMTNYVVSQLKVKACNQTYYHDLVVEMLNNELCNKYKEKYYGTFYGRIRDLLLMIYPEYDGGKMHDITSYLHQFINHYDPENPFGYQILHSPLIQYTDIRFLPSKGFYAVESPKVITADDIVHKINEILESQMLNELMQVEKKLNDIDLINKMRYVFKEYQGKNINPIVNVLTDFYFKKLENKKPIKISIL